MKVTCPSCHAEMSLEALLESESARRAVARLAEISLPFGALVLRYIALFRPAKRRLSIERMVALIEELLPDMQRHAVQRKGREWHAPLESWRAAMETVLAARDKGTLSLPLTSHGYLYEVLAAQADKVESVAEREREKQARSRSVAGPAAGPVPFAAAAVTVLSTATPPPAYSGPSRAAREIQARIAAGQKAREGQTEGAGDDAQA